MLVVVPKHSWVRRLQSFVASQRLERCDVCNDAIPSLHVHVLELESRRLSCVCANCNIKLMQQEGGRYRQVPQLIESFQDFHLTDADWDALQIPIGMAFLFTSAPDNRPVAFYPGPAGATESLLGLGAWGQLVADNPVLADLHQDVEALPVNRTKGSQEYYRVPIDRCYQLVGLIRTRWRGLSGGTEAWEAIDTFFARLCAGKGEVHG